MPESKNTWSNWGYQALKQTIGFVSPDTKKALDIYDNSNSFLKRIVSLGNNPGATEKQKAACEKGAQITQEGRETRAGITGELARSIYLRQLPGLATSGFDLLKSLSQEKWGTKSPDEIYAYQHEVEQILAVSRFIPDFLKKPFLSYIMTPPLETLILNWPGIGGFKVLWNNPEDFQKRIKEKDPNAWIDALRIIHQDIVTGMVTWNQFKSVLS